MTQQLRRLLHGIDATIQGPVDLPIHAIGFDSREVSGGSLFVALRGRRHDGHRYIDDAYQQGAVAALGEEDRQPPQGKTYIKTSNSRRVLARVAAAFYNHPTRKLHTVGITGTKGKTTTAHLCAAVLDRARCLSTVTNAALPRENTTPESLDLQRLAWESVQQGDRHLILEISAHGLVHHRVDGVDLDVGVFTNLSQDHFDDFNGFDDYFAAKAKLLTELQPRLALLNVDDPFGRRLRAQCSQTVWTYGLSPQADFSAEVKVCEPDCTVLNVLTPRGGLELHLRLPGLFNASNALVAVAAGCWAGVPLDQIKSRLEAVSGVPGRFERFVTDKGVHVVVDFAHSPDSLEKMLGFLNGHYARTLTVFGCGGESDPYKRPMMGAISGRLSNYTLITHDNPKREDPLKILTQIEQGIREVSSDYEVIPERTAAIRRALALARAGDCVLVAGKGHETTQVFADRTVHYNDSEFLIAECGAKQATPSTPEAASAPQRLAL